jgi:probable HAF family extracellular repeat protein
MIAGWYEDQSQVTHGLIFDHVTKVDAPGGANTICLGIHSSGAVVGQYTRANGRNMGFLYQNGQFTDIDPFPPGFRGRDGDQ